MPETSTGTTLVRMPTILKFSSRLHFATTESCCLHSVKGPKTVEHLMERIGLVMVLYQEENGTHHAEMEDQLSLTFGV